MPKSTSTYMDAIDRQKTITECQSSVIDLIATYHSLELVERNNFSMLLWFLDAELLHDDSWHAMTNDKTDREDKFVLCYRAISELANADGNSITMNRDNLYFILSFLHEELVQVNQILDCLNSASNHKLDKAEVALPFVQPEHEQIVTPSVAIG